MVGDPRVKVVLYCIIIAALGFSVYANSIGGKFVWDDEDLVRNNIYIKKWAYLPDIFTKDVEAGVGKQSSLYHPIQILTYRIDYLFWKLNPAGYHVTNIMLHVFVGLLVFWLTKILFGKDLLSFLAGAFFVIHPVHTEAVAYISGRSDLLGAIFLILSFILYLKALSGKKMGGYLLLLLCYILALLSKELSIILPFILMLYHYTFKKPIDIKAFLPVAGLSALYITFRLTILCPLLPHSISQTMFLQRLPGFFVAIAHYTRLLFLPFSLHMIYGNKIFGTLSYYAVLGAALTALMLIYAFLKKGSDKLISFSIGWFFLMLLPVSNIYPINAYMAEHWLYLPSVGFFLILAKVLTNIQKAAKYRWINNYIAISVIVALVAFYSFATIKQNRYWREPIALYNRTLHFAPNDAKIYNNLGNAYKDAGMTRESIDSYNKAIEIKPDHAEAYNNLGNAYYDMGRTADATEMFKKAIEIRPYAEVYNNLGVVYSDMGSLKEAADLFAKAIEANPDYANAYNNLGNILSQNGRTEKAIKAFNMAIKINPDFAIAYDNIGDAYLDIKDTDRAILAYKRCIAKDPKFIKAYNDLGTAYHISGRNKEANEMFSRAIKIDPSDTSGYVNLANVYIITGIIGRHERAIALLNKALELNPSSAEAYNSLGNAYAARKENKEAITSYNAAIKLDPKYAAAHSNLAVVLYYEKRYDEAVVSYDRAIELGSMPNPEFAELIKERRK